METLYGKEVYVVDRTVPRMGPSDEFVRLQSPELVASLAQWMIEFFGTKYLVKDGEILYSPTALFMNPNTYIKVKEACSKRTSL